MEKPSKKELQKPKGGLLLMSMMTLLWMIIFEIFCDRANYRSIGIVFLIPVCFFVYNYIIFYHANKELADGIPDSQEEKVRDKWFLRVFAAEGIAIFLIKNILINIDHDELFIACLALIVGLHFIPLAKIFKRTFDYYIGVWTILISVTGLLLLVYGIASMALTNSLLSIGCAVSTSCYGMKMVYDGRAILRRA